ncbi:MAG: hydantoinase B/oxoprolinase family protein, partial [Chloroflexi bacterium]|nr:hydantoinase B/oxoprolinase family protein [Chloroflexota bacterium]
MPPTAAMVLLLACSICSSSSAGAASPAPSEAWLSSVRATVEAEEYQASWQDATPFDDVPGAYQAPNRAQGFRTWFLPEGIRLVPRTGNGEWQLSLTLAGWGRAASDPDRASTPTAVPRTLDPATVRVAGDRVEYGRAGLDEWYVNGPAGLEQGFTLGAPPEAEGPRVAVRLALGGTLDPRLSEDRQAIDFVSPDGRVVLHYAQFQVVDALGHELPAWMEGWADDGRRGIRLVFDDRDARYPVTIDPLLTGPSWTVAGDAAGVRFGYAVAGAGDVNGDGFSDVIVGAPGYDNGQLDEGRAYVFLGSSHGLSTTAFPSGVRTTPTEVNEVTSPLVIWRREYRTDSAGAGEYRGGLGQVVEIGHRDGAAFMVSKMFDRLVHPPRGRQGGADGLPGLVYLDDGTVLKGKGLDRVPAGARLVMETPGGGGMGDV